MAFRKEVFDKAGYWSSDIGAKGGQSLKDGEEAEFCLRIKHEMPDSIILYESNAVIYHKVPVDRATTKWILRRSFMQGQSKSMVEKLIPKPKEPMVSSPQSKPLMPKPKSQES